MPTHAKWGPALRLDPIRIAKKLPPGSHECCLSDAPGRNTARDFFRAARGHAIHLCEAIRSCAIGLSMFGCRMRFFERRFAVVVGMWLCRYAVVRSMSL